VKLATTFYGYFSTTFNLTANSIARTRGVADIPRLAMDMLLLWSLPATMGLAIKTALRGGDDDDETSLGAKLIKEHAAYLMSTMVGVREFSGVATGFDYSGPAGLRAIDAVVDLSKQIKQGDGDAALFDAILRTSGILLHLPTGQIEATLDGYRYQQEHRSGPLPVLFGPPPGR